MKQSTASAIDDKPGAWAPLRHRAFAILWFATLVSNIGTWMNDVGAGWLMASLSTSPTLVALVQTAMTLPVFLFGLPAGALADIVDKRKLLLCLQAVMALLSGGFALLVGFGLVTPSLLLIFTFLLGTCTAFVAPAMQAVMPRLVPKAEMQQAIALGGVGVNVSRAIGPALGGLVIVAFGLWSPFALNALSFVGIIIALLWWQPAPVQAPVLPAEQMREAIRAGLYYAFASQPMRATLLRALAFFFSASAFWALLPLIARGSLQGGAGLYGLLLAAVGAGAVSGAMLLPKLRAAIGANHTVAAGTLLIAAILAVLGWLPWAPLVALLCFGYGLGWIGVVSSLNIAAQLALPDWARGRGLSVYLTVFFGALSAGSAVWGQVSALASVPLACSAAAVCALLGLVMMRRVRLPQGDGDDLNPSLHWPRPGGADTVPHERGPVLTSIRYQVSLHNQQVFVQQMQLLQQARKRLGAHGWELLEDVANPGLFTENFRDLTWLAHLRHHERVTESDRALQDRIKALTVPGSAIEVSHFVSSRAQGSAGPGHPQ